MLRASHQAMKKPSSSRGSRRCAASSSAHATPRGTASSKRRAPRGRSGHRRWASAARSFFPASGLSSRAARAATARHRYVRRRLGRSRDALFDASRFSDRDSSCFAAGFMSSSPPRTPPASGPRSPRHPPRSHLRHPAKLKSYRYSRHSPSASTSPAETDRRRRPALAYTSSYR